jgi:hypothetical protein
MTTNISSNDNKYGYSLQYCSIEDYKVRDQVFEGNIYTNINDFIIYVNSELNEAIYCYELDENQEKILTFTKEQSKYNLPCYPITKEYIENYIKDYEYIYYPDNAHWVYLIVKHKII